MCDNQMKKSIDHLFEVMRIEDLKVIMMNQMDVIKRLKEKESLIKDQAILINELKSENEYLKGIIDRVKLKAIHLEGVLNKCKDEI